MANREIHNQVIMQNRQAGSVTDPNYLSKLLNGDIKRELENWRYDHPHRVSKTLEAIVAEVEA